ncbi:MAG: DUF5371 family protein [Archaeoglobaceae archaeon]
MRKFVIVNLKFSNNTIYRLKEKTEEETTKEALSKAITHYLHCHRR